MNLPAGNWDAAFVDDPDNLDIDRNTRGHLGFGFGVHQCIGQNLARVELQVALSTLVRRLPGLRLAVPAGGAGLRGREGDLRHARTARHLVTGLADRGCHFARDRVAATIGDQAGRRRWSSATP